MIQGQPINGSGVQRELHRLAGYAARSIRPVFVTLFLIVWLLSGWPAVHIGEDLRFPPAIPKAHAVACGFGTDIGGGVCQGFLTVTGSNQTFTSPSDWNNSNNTIECIGAGASGAATHGSTTTTATGGGAGAYSSISKLTFATPGTTTATYRIGSGGTAVTRTTAGSTAGNTGGDSWFNNTTFPGAGTTNLYCGAKGGSPGAGGAQPQSGGAGGVGTSGWGQTRRSGGSGGNVSHNSVATGGGGAAGNANVGGNGVNSSGTNAATNGGQANGTGATGGGGQSGAASQTGGNGNPGTEYTSQGSGGGGGGARSTNKNTTATGGSGGARGGGGAAALIASANSGTTATSGAGADGIIVVTYTPAITVSGNIYQSGSESNANATSVSVSVSVNNGTPTTVTSQTGSYTVSIPTPTGGDVVAVYIDGHATLDATAFSVANGSAMGNMHLYIDKTAIYNHNSGNTTNSHICTTQATYPTSGDRTYSCPGSNVLTADSGAGSDELHVAGGYAPGAAVNVTKLHIVTGGTYTGSTETLTISGTGTTTSRPFFIDSGTFTPTSNTTVFTGGASSDLQNTTYYNLTINGTGPFNGMGSTTVNNELLISSGTLAMGANDLNVGSSTSNSGSVKVASAGVVSQTSSATTTILSSASGSNCIGADGASCAGTPGTIGFYNLTVGNASTTFTTSLAASATMTVAGVLTVTTNATYAEGSGTTTVLSGAGTPLVNNGTMSFNTSGSITRYTSSTGVTALASGAGASISYGDLEISGTGTFNAGKTVNATRSLKVISGTLAMGSFDLYSGLPSLTNSGSIQVSSGASLTQGNANATYILSSNGGSNCIGGSGASCTGTQGTITFGDLVVGNGTDSSTTTMAGDAPVITVTGTTNGLYINGNGTLSANGTINLSTNFYHATNGVFTANSSTVNLTAVAADTTQKIEGTVDTTFFTLSAATGNRTLQFSNGRTVSATSFTLTGTACTSMLLLRSTSFGSQFTLTDIAGGSTGFSYADIQDMNATNAMTALTSADSGNNTSVTIGENACHGATTNASGTGYGFQRKSFYDTQNLRYFEFFHDGDELETRYSTDGTNWTSDDDHLDYDTNDFSVWYKTISSTSYVWLAVTSGTDIVVRRGTLSTTGVAWEASVITALSTTYAYPSITLDSSDYIWIAARHTDGSNYVVKTVRSDATAATTWSSMTFGTTVTVRQINQNQTATTVVYGVIVPLSSQNMYLVYGVGTSLLGCKWDNAQGGGARWETSGDASCENTGSADTAGTTFGALEDNFSVVSDASDNVHLVYIDGTGATQISYNRWNGSWGTKALVTDTADTYDSYPSLGRSSTGTTLYAFWVDTVLNDVYSSSCTVSTGCDAASEWNPEVSVETAGTPKYMTSGYESGGGKLFVTYQKDNTCPCWVTWSSVSVASNAVPSAPTTLYANEDASGAQSGVTNPTSVGDTSPVFSAVYEDQDAGDVANKYQVVVYSDVSCTQEMYNSGAGGTSITNCTQGNRCADVTYMNANLEQNGLTYYWKIRFWDDEPSAGTFSDCTSTFTMLGTADQMRHGAYFFNKSTERSYTW